MYNCRAWQILLLCEGRLHHCSDLWSALPKRASPALSWSKSHWQQPVGLCRARSIVAPPSIGLSTLAAWNCFPCVSLGLPVNQRCQLRNRDEFRRRLITNFPCGNQFPLKVDAASDPGALMMDPVPGDPGGGPESRDRAGIITATRLSTPLMNLPVGRGDGAGDRPDGGRRPFPPCPSPGREAGGLPVRPAMARYMASRACAASADSMRPPRPRRGRRAVSRIRVRASACFWVSLRRRFILASPIRASQKVFLDPCGVFPHRGLL